MTTLREAAQQALEALDGELPGWRTPAQERAITALKAALVQPEQEPVAWVNHGENRITRATGWDGYGALYTHPTRREWRGLTDEEIRDLWSWSATAEAERIATTQQHAFARAIEAALKEKNDG